MSATMHILQVNTMIPKFNGDARAGCSAHLLRLAAVLFPIPKPAVKKWLGKKTSEVASEQKHPEKY